MTREDRGKGTRLSLLLNDWTSSNCSSKTLSGLLSFLAATLAQKYVLQVLQSFCVAFLSATWHMFLIPEWSLPEDKRSLPKIKCIPKAWQTYIHTTQLPIPGPLSAIQCLTLMRSAIMDHNISRKMVYKSDAHHIPPLLKLHTEFYKSCMNFREAQLTNKYRS